MGTGTRLRNGIVAVFFCCVACLCISCGPAAAPVTDSRPPVDLSLIERSASLYLLPTESQTLLIEVDAVEGCEPKQVSMSIG